VKRRVAVILQDGKQLNFEDFTVCEPKGGALVVTGTIASEQRGDLQADGESTVIIPLNRIQMARVNVVRVQPRAGYRSYQEERVASGREPL
jgi:hypothetical protein